MYPDDLEEQDDIQVDDPYCNKEEEQGVIDHEEREYNRRYWFLARRAQQAHCQQYRDVRPLYHARHEQGRNGSPLDRRG